MDRFPRAVFYVCVNQVLRAQSAGQSAREGRTEYSLFVSAVAMRRMAIYRTTTYNSELLFDIPPPRQ